MYIAAAICGNPQHGAKLASFYGASSELMQMVVDDLTANPLEINPPIPHASTAVVNPEAVFPSGWRDDTYLEGFYEKLPQDVQQELMVLDTFVRKHFLKSNDTSTNYSSFLPAEEMPYHYYQYYCALQQFQPGKINSKRGHLAPDPDGDDGDSSGGGDDSSDSNEDSDNAEAADEPRKKPPPKKAKAGTFIFDGVDAILVKHPNDWYGVGTEMAIQSLNFVMEYCKKHILVELNREMQFLSKSVRILGKEITKYHVSRRHVYSCFLTQNSHIYVIHCTIRSLNTRLILPRKGLDTLEVSLPMANW